MKRTFDVIVVGGGVIGCAVAYELARRAARVLLIDKDLPGRATSASAGGLWPVGEAVGLGCGVIYHSAQTSNGSGSHLPIVPDSFRDFLVASNARFPSLAGELRELTQIDIEYHVGAGLVYVAYDEGETRFVECVIRALPPQFKPTRLTRDEARRIEPGLTPKFHSAALLEGEHQVNPMLLAEAYKRAAIRLGAQFLHDTAVAALHRVGDRVVGVELDGESLAAGTVINAAGSWSAKLAATAGIRLNVHPIRGQIVLTQCLPSVLRGCLSTSGCYLAQKSHGEVLIGSTTENAGFDVSVVPAAIEALCRAAVRVVPGLAAVGIKRIWAGLRPGTPDELPILGPVSGVEGYLNATGGFRTGIVSSPLTATVVAQCAMGETTDVPIEPFLAARFEQQEAEAPATSVVQSHHA